ncbi:redoxin family protein [Candidatus Jorgensenbacteria bacterium]|nr:redoxin family protein [Candidatus Jorgensenbacteria bacterium]
MNNRLRNTLLFVVLVLIGGSIFYFQSGKPSRINSSISDGLGISDEASAPDIVNPSGFINTDPFLIKNFIGKKVILVDFWTYSCINCQRTIPYLNAWWDTYKNKGLVIVGVHTPEFEFEKEYANVKRAVEKFGIAYPVVLDNDHATWTAYNNRYWPHKYLIDIHGKIIYDHVGEGSYERTENKIKQALKERAVVLGVQEDSVVGSGPVEAVDVDFEKVGSPEIYFGSARNEYFADAATLRGRYSGVEPKDIKTNNLYLVGDWDIKEEFAENLNRRAKIVFRYRAKNVYIVGSASSGVHIKVLRDGVPIMNVAGVDVIKSDSSVFIKEDRLYHLVGDTTYGEHTLELIIEEPGFRAFTFTFG